MFGSAGRSQSARPYRTENYNHVASMERLKRRTDFLAAAKGARAPAGAFVLQARRRAEDSRGNDPVRVGFTVSRQVGNAVERNRVRRRLREMVRLAPAPGFRPGHDYVLIGRRAALDANFADMTRQFDAALRRIHADAKSGQENRPATGGAEAAPLHRAGSPPSQRDNQRDERRDDRRPKPGPRREQRKHTDKSA
jgi:ribonuclease P protein component